VSDKNTGGVVLTRKGRSSKGNGKKGPYDEEENKLRRGRENTRLADWRSASLALSFRETHTSAWGDYFKSVKRWKRSREKNHQNRKRGKGMRERLTAVAWKEESSFQGGPSAANIPSKGGREKEPHNLIKEEG